MSQDNNKKKVLGRGLESLLPSRLVQEAKQAIINKDEARKGTGIPTPLIATKAAVAPHAAEAPATKMTIADVVEKVQQAGIEAAAAGISAQLLGVAEAEVMVALADASHLKTELAKDSAERLQTRFTKEFLAERRIRPGEMVVQVPVNLITRNPYQTRWTAVDDPGLAELSESIKVHGVMQPVVVTPLKQAGPQGEVYHLIAGERRWLSSKMAGLSHIPAMVRELPPTQIAVLTIIENLLRQDLNPMQHARAFRRLMDDFRLTQEEIAQQTGVARSAVANYIRLTRLPEFVQKAIEEGRMSFGHAKVLMPLGNAEGMDLCAKKVLAMRLSVRETEQLVEEFLRPPISVEKPERKVDPNVRAAEDELKRSLGCRVQIKDRNGKGKIVIEYQTLEDFDRVIEALK